MPLRNRFADYLALELNRSPHTVKAYMHDIQSFFEFANSIYPDFKPEATDLPLLRRWLAALSDHDSTRTLRRKTQSLRAFFQWMMRQGYITSNPAAEVVLAKIPSKLPEFVKESELEELLATPTQGDFHAARTHIVLLLLYSTGIRREELRTVTDADIDFSLREMRVLGKRSKQRILPLPDPLIAEIREWQKIRDNRYPSLPEPRPLIAGKSGAVSPATLYKIVNDSLSATSATKKSPHVLRHTFATTMLNNGSSLDSVKEFLGHTSLSTTQIYTHLTFSQLRDAYTAAHPRANSSPAPTLPLRQLHPLK